MITECRCPKCGQIYENYWDFNDPEESYGNDDCCVTYRIHCDCDCLFAYTEYYKLTETETTIL